MEKKMENKRWRKQKRWTKIWRKMRSTREEKVKKK